MSFILRIGSCMRVYSTSAYFLKRLKVSRVLAFCIPRRGKPKYGGQFTMQCDARRARFTSATRIGEITHRTG